MTSRNCAASNWVHKIENSRRYQPDPQGLMNMAALLTLRDKVIKPVLADATQLKQGRKPNRLSDLDLQYGRFSLSYTPFSTYLGLPFADQALEVNIDNFLSIDMLLALKEGRNSCFEYSGLYLDKSWCVRLVGIQHACYATGSRIHLSLVRHNRWCKSE
jgi:hypothetical protein